MISGLILSGARPIFLLPEVCGRTGLVGSVTPAAIAQAFQAHPDLKAVLIVSPTYEGICAETGAIAALCHAQGIPLLVDEAHGPHFGFHPDLPASALSQGATVSVQSTHKVLSGLTQSAMLHLRPWDPRSGECLIDPGRVAQALQLVQSSSPSYLLLAALDAARSQMATQGHALMTQTLALANQARDRLRQIPGLRVFELPQPQPGFAQLDPTRLTVDVSALGLTGFEADEILNENYGVIAELPSLWHLTFIISLGNNAVDIEQLVTGFAAMAERACDKTFHATCQETFENQFDPKFGLWREIAIGAELGLSPREAYFSAAETIALPDGIGQISAETVCPYPPGIPVLLPGERIGSGAIAYLRKIQAAGGIISGASDPSLETLRVIR